MFLILTGYKSSWLFLMEEWTGYELSNVQVIQCMFIKVAVLWATEMKPIPVEERTLLQDTSATERQEYV